MRTAMEQFVVAVNRDLIRNSRYRNLAHLISGISYQGLLQDIPLSFLFKIQTSVADSRKRVFLHLEVSIMAASEKLDLRGKGTYA